MTPNKKGAAPELRRLKRLINDPLSDTPLRAVTSHLLAAFRDRRLKDGEFEKLQDAATACRNMYVWPAIQFAIHTAMRRSEILSLKWNSINQTARFANLRDTKNGSNRMVPLSNAALLILANLPKDTVEVFATSDYAIRHSWDRLIARAEIKDLRFHDLRHAAISRMLEAGLSISAVASVCGHKDYRMLAKYDHQNIMHVGSHIFFRGDDT